MGLREDIQNSISAAFDDELQDIVTEFTLQKKVSEGTYDPVEDTYQPEMENYLSRGVSMPVTSGLVMSGTALYTDETLLALADDIGAAPEEGDTIVMGDSTYRVLNSSAVAAGNTLAIIYNMIIRKND